MQFSLSTLLITLGASLGVSAYDVTAYQATTDCNQSNDATLYRIFTGTDTNCHAIGGSASSGATCAEYADGGIKGPNNCGVSRQSSADSVLFVNSDCVTYTSVDCSGTEVKAPGECAGKVELVDGPVRSFKCK